MYFKTMGKGWPAFPFVLVYIFVIEMCLHVHRKVIKWRLFADLFSAVHSQIFVSCGCGSSQVDNALEN